MIPISCVIFWAHFIPFSGEGNLCFFYNGVSCPAVCLPPSLMASFPGLELYMVPLTHVPCVLLVDAHPLMAFALCHWLKHWIIPQILIQWHHMPEHVLGVWEMVVSKKQSLPFQFSEERKRTDIK